MFVSVYLQACTIGVQVWKCVGLTVESGRGHQVGFPGHVQALDRPGVEGKQALWIRSLHTKTTLRLFILLVYHNM